MKGYTFKLSNNLILDSLKHYVIVARASIIRSIFFHFLVKEEIKRVQV